MKEEPSAIKRLILARPDRIGDVVISSSALEPVRKALPGVELHMLAHSRMAPLFRGHPLLASFISLPARNDAAARMESLAVQLRRCEADCIVHLHSDPEVEWAAAAAEIPRRIGFGHRKDKWLTESVSNTKKQGHQHEGYFNFDLLDLIGVPAPAHLVPRLAPEEEARERLKHKLPAGLREHPYAVLHVGAHDKKPRIAPAYFIEAARWLVADRRYYVVIIGEEKNDPGVKKILAGLGSSAAWVYDFCGQSDLAETAWLLRDAAVVFGRDSGPAHLAAAMGARTVTLMLEPEKENSSKRWKPLGKHSWVLEKPLRRRVLESRPGFARRNLEQFSPDEIVAALHRALEA